MAKSVIIKLTTAGTSTGPFNLLSDYDSYVSPFETNIAKATLVTGYTSSLVPNTATIVRVLSSGSCTNHTDLTIVPTTTTSTTTTTTTIPFQAEITFTTQHVNDDYETYMTVTSGTLLDSIGASGTIQGYTDTGCSTSSDTGTFTALTVNPGFPGYAHTLLTGNPHIFWQSRKLTSLLVQSTPINSNPYYLSVGANTYKIVGWNVCETL